MCVVLKMIKYIITGGPGCGKTTLINLLADAGHIIAPEAARLILKQQPYLSGSELQEKIFFKQIEIETELNQKYGNEDVVVFLDRGLIDGKGYSDYFKCNFVTDYKIELKDAKYEQIVFLLKPLEKKDFLNDETRKETYAESLVITDYLKKAYTDEGFTVIELEATNPKDKFNKIMSYITEN